MAKPMPRTNKPEPICSPMSRPARGARIVHEIAPRLPEPDGGAAGAERLLGFDEAPLSLPDRQVHVELRSATELALELDGPRVQQHQPPRDGQTETGAALVRALAVGLLVLLEDHRALVGADAGAGVDDAERDEARGGGDLDDDLAFLRELDGVADQVGDHLTHAARVDVAHDPRRAFHPQDHRLFLETHRLLAGDLLGERG